MMLFITGKLFSLISAMQNIPSELMITVKNHINITLFKMKGSPDLGQADKFGNDEIERILSCKCTVLCYVWSHFAV